MTASILKLAVLSRSTESRRFRIAGLVTVGVLLIAASVVTAETQDCATIVVSSIPDLAQPNGFVATEILDLTFTVRLDPDGLNTNHVLNIAFHGPDGQVYENRTVPFAVAAGPESTIRLPGYPHPVPVQSALPVIRNGDMVAEVQTRLPVAGTAIVSHSLYGVWRVGLNIDGEPPACIVGDEFVITLTPSSEIFRDGFESADTTMWIGGGF